MEEREKEEEMGPLQETQEWEKWLEGFRSLHNIEVIILNEHD